MTGASAAATVGVCIEPLDVLFFRDGRPFTGSERSVSGLPLPQTFAGAIRTALLRAAGCDFGRLKQGVESGKSFDEAVRHACGREYHWIGRLAVRGPWLSRRSRTDEELEVLVPAPAVLHKQKSGAAANLLRLAPLPAGQLPGWSPPQDQQGLRPLWMKEFVATEPAEGYLTRNALEQFLRGEDVAGDAVIPSSDLFGLDYRTGIGISPDRLVAEESQVFGRGFLALKRNVLLYAEVVLSGDAGNGSLLDEVTTMPLGGEGRYVLLRRLPKPYAWPSSPPQAAKHRPLVLLITPCAFQGGWKPRALDSRLVAAAVSGSLAFSGWDLARGGPKPTRFAVPAGSVYFLESLPDDWQHSLAENDEECRQGWGYCLIGVWTDD
jgi:CRISPR-associated protein Cmr3